MFVPKCKSLFSPVQYSINKTVLGTPLHKNSKLLLLLKNTDCNSTYKKRVLNYTYFQRMTNSSEGDTTMLQ